MSSKEEIKTAFTAELKNTPQYQIVLNIKQFILDEIARPNIQKNILYTFETEQTDDEIEILKMCLFVEFGFKIINIGKMAIGINMELFLD